MEFLERTGDILQAAGTEVVQDENSELEEDLCFKVGGTIDGGIL